MKNNKQPKPDRANLRVVDLYCGAGGMSKGLKDAGFDIVRAYDIDDKALAVYRWNLGDHAKRADLGNSGPVVPEIRSLKPDMIVGGPPCQDFSTAGRRMEGVNADQTMSFALIVAACRPKWFVMENVRGLLGSNVWHEARSILLDQGYGLTIKLLDASYYGVPQSRKRIFVIGRLGEAHRFLDEALVAAAADRRMVLRDMFGDDDADSYWLHPRGSGRRGAYDINEPIGTIRTPARRRRPPHRKVHPSDARLLARGAVAIRPWCKDAPILERLEGPDPRDFVSPREAVTLTQEQTARIQGYPPDWDWSGGGAEHDVDRLIANSVPAPQACIIGEVIRARELGETIPLIEEPFARWLRENGLSGRAIRNTKTRVNRARRLLTGRIFAELSSELAVLEKTPEFQALPVKTRSDLRCALRHYRSWREDEPPGSDRRELFPRFGTGTRTKRNQRPSSRQKSVGGSVLPFQESRQRKLKK